MYIGIIVGYPRPLKQVKFLRIILFSLYIGLVETDPEGALAGFAEVVQMEQEKAEW